MVSAVRVGVRVRHGVRVYQILVSFSSLWPAVTQCA